MTPFTSVTVPVVTIRTWAGLWWVTACTCGKHRTRHVTYDGALRAAEVHELTHLRPA